MAFEGYDPSQANQWARSTDPDAIRYFNNWIRAQPWWKAIVPNAGVNITDEQKNAVKAAMAQHGISPGGHIEISDQGDLTKTAAVSWGDVAKWGLIGGGAALGGLGLFGIGPLGALGGAGAAGEGAAAAGAGGEAAGIGAGAAGAAAGGAAGGGGMLAGLGGIGGLIKGGLGVAGAIAQGRAQGRVAEADTAARMAQLLQNAAVFNRQNPMERMRGAVRGDILANVQPAAYTGEGRNFHATGGLTPALLSPGTRQLGQSASRQAMLSQLGSTGEGPKPANDPYGQFTPADLPQAGRLDTALGIAGLAGAALPFFRGAGSVPAGPAGSNPDITSLYAKYGGQVPPYEDIYGMGGQ